jgi:3-hydroxybutyryl-CoA dehydrogenase
MPRDLAIVGVIGLGTMGAGIAAVVARTGLGVVAVDVDEAGVAHGRRRSRTRRRGPLRAAS